MDLIRVRNLIPLLILLFATLKNETSCQNLVPNGDFEISKHFFAFRTLGGLSLWQKANPTTPDYCTSPRNIGGIQIAHSGSGYCGIVLSLDTTTGYKYVEYIRIKLVKALEPNKAYCLRMYLSRADNEFYAVKWINFKFSSHKLYSTNRAFIETDRFGVLEYSIDTILGNKKDWMNVCSCYKANGGEKYLTIGYFDPNIKLIKVEKGRPRFHSAYYFIDDVSLNEVDDTSGCNCSYKNPNPIGLREPLALERSIDSLTINDSIILENVHFEINKWEIRQESDETLDEFFNLLQRHPEIKLEISGHTDNTGNENNNLFLSENRARAVAYYLTGRGISAGRINYMGYGSSRPIGDNQTENGRTKNRRVEIKVLTR